MVLLGKILKLKGNRGEVVIEPSPELQNCFPLEAGEYILESKKYRKILNLQSCKESGAKYILSFEGLNSIPEAYKLIGYSLYSEKIDFETVNENSFIGYKVLDSETHENWGKVSTLIEGNMSQLIELDNGTLIPVCDEIIKEIDKDSLTIYIDPPEGLKDLNRS